MEATIGRPPEFGRDGAWPPVRSADTEVSRLSVDAPGRMLPTIVVSTVEPATYAFEIRLADNERLTLTLRYNMYCTWVEETVYHQFWERDDPPLQLPPGTSDEYGTARRVGLSRERAREIATTIGLSGNFSSQLSTKTAIKLTMTEEETSTRKITVTNPQTDRYRLVARWYLYNRLSRVVSPRLTSDGEKIYSSVAELGFDTAVQVLASAEYLASDATVMTFIDLPSETVSAGPP